jgi:hypothetical protein
VRSLAYFHQVLSRRVQQPSQLYGHAFREFYLHSLFLNNLLYSPEFVFQALVFFAGFEACEGGEVYAALGFSSKKSATNTIIRAMS